MELDYYVCFPLLLRTFHSFNFHPCCMQHLGTTEDVFTSRVQNKIPGAADFILKPEMYQPVNYDNSPDPLFYAGRYDILYSKF